MAVARPYIYIVDRAEKKNKDGDTYVAYLEWDPAKYKKGKPLCGCKGFSDIDNPRAFEGLNIRAKDYSIWPAICAITDARDKNGVFTFDAFLDRASEEVGYAKFVNRKFTFSYNGEDNDTVNLILKNVVVGTKTKRYDLDASNFINFDMLRQFNAGEKVDAVDALVELMDQCTGMLRHCHLHGFAPS